MEKDFVSSIFFSDNERYADIINGIGCDGIPFVKGKDLQETDTKVLFRAGRGLLGKAKKMVPKYRDLMRKTAFGINFAMIGIENQEEIDYALPLRAMCYDVGEYEKQAAKICREVRRNRKGLTSGEYLYGFRRDSRLFPTVTFILYYGEKDWDGPKDIHGLLDFTDIPESLKEKISNYQVHVIEVRKLKDTSMFQTDVRQVFDFIRFSKDKEKLGELVDRNQAYQMLDEDAYDMVAAYVGEWETMFKLKEKHKKDGKVNMCQGLRDWLAEERMAGEAEESERMSKLIIILTEQSRQDDLLKAAKDIQYKKKMYKEFGL